MRWIASVLCCVALNHCAASSLQNVFDMAQDHSMSWRAKALETHSQQLTGDIALGALLPKVGIQASQSSGLSYYDPYFIDSALQAGDSIPFAQSALSMQLTVPFYAPAAVKSYQSATIAEKITTYDYEIFQNTYILELTTRYFDILKKNKSLHFSNQQIIMREKFYKDITERYEVGLVALTDLSEAAAALDQAKAAHIQAVFSLERAQSTLTTLLSTPLDCLNDLSWQDNIVLPPRKTLQGPHPAILKAQSMVDYSRTQTEMYQSHLLPTISGSSSYNFAPLNSSVAHSLNSVNAGISLSWSPPSGMSSMAQITQSQYLFEASQAQYAQASIEHSTQLELYAQQFYSMTRQIQAQRTTVLSANTYLEAVLASFEAGQRTTTDVLEAQQFLLQQQEQLYGLMYDSLVLHLQLGLENHYPIKELIADIDRNLHKICISATLESAEMF